MLPPLGFRCFMFICGLNHIKIHPHPVGTGLAPVRNKLHIKSGQRTAARAVPTVLYIFQSVVQAPSDGQRKGCCEQYGANDDEVGRWLAAAVKSQQINGYK